MDWKDAFLGEHAMEVWASGMFWSLIGIIAVKLFFLDSKVNFKIKYWVNDNLADVIKGMLWSLVVLRLGDVAIHVVEKFGGIEVPETTDFVVVMIFISGAIQYKLHKKRSPISEKVALKMHVHNEFCNHNKE